MCVLIVEDDSTLSLVYKLNLDKLGLNAFIANSGEEALAEIRCNSSQYGLVLMDLGLPSMDGLSVTHEMRKIGIQQPIVAITAGHSNKEECLKAGMNDYYVKPVFINQLENIIKKWNVRGCS